MSRLFGGKGSEKTIAIVDVENGSVGAALVRTSRHDAPKLFGQKRVSVPLLNTRNTETLLSEIIKAAREALLHTSAVAARMRMHKAMVPHGSIDRVAVFLSAPWASMHLSGGTGDFADPLVTKIKEALIGTFGDRKFTFHPFGTAAAHGVVTLFPYENPSIVCIISGEVAELLVIEDDHLIGRATMPVGLHTLLRTLVAHAGISPEEARSWLKLNAAAATPSLREPLAAARSHFVLNFAEVAQELLKTNPVDSILVVAPSPAEEWYARSLSENDSLSNVFPHGGTVRAVRANHAMPFIAAHASAPDLPLMLEALFVDAKFSGYA